MLGDFGFSYVGLCYLILLVVPNVIWATRQKGNANKIPENKILLWFERVGQVSVVVCALIFSNFNPTRFDAWTAWLLASGACMLLYLVAWVRYFLRPSQKTFYGRLLFIPLPLAVLPVFAFLLLGIYGKVIWLVMSAIVFGIGHIGVHLDFL